MSSAEMMSEEPSGSDSDHAAEATGKRKASASDRVGTSSKKRKQGAKDKDAGNTKPKRKRLRKRIAASRVIPNTYDECDTADKKLIEMRDGGASWDQIRQMWEEETGEKMAASTLPNRYERLMSNFNVINEEDHVHLMEAKHEVEQDFEGKKWTLIAQAVAERSENEYEPAVLNRVYKKLMLREGAVPPLTIKDPDFAIDVDGSPGDDHDDSA